MLRVLWASLLAAAVLATNAGAANAADEIGLSPDGRTWGDDLGRPLYDPAMRWVPGDVETRSFWVRNDGPATAAVRIGVRTTDPDALLADEDLLVAARMPGGAWVPLPAAGESRALTDATLARGGRTRVDVRVAFDPAATNRTELDRLPMEIVVRLTEAGGGGPEDGRPDADGPGVLPDTGTTVEPWLLWLAAGLLGGGFVLLAARRRDEEDADG